MAAAPAPRHAPGQGRPPHGAPDEGLGPRVPRRPPVPAGLDQPRPTEARREAGRAGPDPDVPGHRLPPRRRGHGRWRLRRPRGSRGGRRARGVDRGHERDRRRAGHERRDEHRRQAARPGRLTPPRNSTRPVHPDGPRFAFGQPPTVTPLQRPGGAAPSARDPHRATLDARSPVSGQGRHCRPR